jgi:tryptophanyl-tRNA synthetase
VSDQGHGMDWFINVPSSGGLQARRDTMTDSTQASETRSKSNPAPASGATDGTARVILSGMQPTGQLHLGNLEGALANWVQLQSDYEMYCCIVDWHSLTADFEQTEGMQERIVQMAVDYLAAGLDPERCAIFVQSQVKEHAELHLLLSMIVPVPWLERMPTYKDKRDNLGLDSYGFLGYPVLQAADILLYRAHLVPVGKDQERHIIFARDVAGRFNHMYGQEVFPLPEAKFTESSEIPGTDGRKMSKSYGNDVRIADSPEETTEKVRRMFTDPQKVRKNDPGRPDICPVFKLHKLYSEASFTAEVQRTCQTGELGCVDCKKDLARHLNLKLAPLRERRAEWAGRLDDVWAVLEAGAERARARASETMTRVRAAMHLQ